MISKAVKLTKPGDGSLDRGNHRRYFTLNYSKIVCVIERDRESERENCLRSLVRWQWLHAGVEAWLYRDVASLAVGGLIRIRWLGSKSYPHA